MTHTKLALFSSNSSRVHTFDILCSRFVSLWSKKENGRHKACYVMIVLMFSSPNLKTCFKIELNVDMICVLYLKLSEGRTGKCAGEIDDCGSQFLMP